MDSGIMWEQSGVVHNCEGARMVPFDAGTFLVWTKCGKDVPAGAAFRNPKEHATCPDCARLALNGRGSQHE